MLTCRIKSCIHPIYFEKTFVGKDKVAITPFKVESGGLQDVIIKANPVSTDDIHFTTESGVALLFEYPSKNKLNTMQSDSPKAFDELIQHTKDIMDQFEVSLKPQNLHDEKLGPAARIDFQSFINYILIQEVTKNIDGFRRSVYLTLKDGKIFAGPVWDFNLALGNLWWYGQNHPEGWQQNRDDYDDNLDGNHEIWWYVRLLKNKVFRDSLIKTYKNLRKDGQAFATAEMFKDIDSNVNQIGRAQLRQYSKWNLLGSPLMTFWFTPPSWPMKYSGEIAKLKEWIEKRMAWLDREIDCI